MNLNKIREILDNDLIFESTKRYAIIREIAEDKNAVKDILQIIEAERDETKKLILEMNEIISKSKIGLENKKLNKQMGGVENIIHEFYKKMKGRFGIGYLFKETNLNHI